MTTVALTLTLWILGYIGVGFTLVALVLTLRHHHRARRAHASGTLERRGQSSQALELPAITLLVPCEGAEGGLLENLRSHLHMPYQSPRQVIFAAPGPQDGSSAIIEAVLKEPLPPNVTAEVVYSQHAPAALNRKMRHLAAAESRIQHPVVVAADSDTRLESQTLTTLIEALVANDAHGLAFAPPRFPVGRTLGEQLLSFGFASSPHAFHTLAALSAFIGDDIPVVGSLLAIRRTSLEAVGGYRALGGHIGDDLELARRVGALGQKVVTAPCTVPCPEPELTFGGLFAKVHRWVTVGASYGPWRLLSYPFLLAPLPVLLLLLGAVGISSMMSRLPELDGLLSLGLPVGVAEALPALLAWSWVPVVATLVLRLGFAWSVGPLLYGRAWRGLDLGLLLVWEHLLVWATVRAVLSPVVTWRGRSLLIRPGGAMLSLHEPLRPGMPELPARKSGYNDMVLAPYLEHMVRGAFQGVYVRGLELLRAQAGGQPLIFVANHCSFWDGLLACHLHQGAIEHDFYIFMEDTQLRRYPFMQKAGAFSINRKNIRSAVASLKYAEELLSDPSRAVWIFPQGQWRPQEARPLKLELGVGHLAKARRDALVVPVTFHYTFRDGPKASVFIDVGTPLSAPDHGEEVRTYVMGLEQRLTRQLDASAQLLADTALERIPEGYEAVLTGRPGVAELWDRFRHAVGLQLA